LSVLSLTKKVDYGLIAAVHLARAGERVCSAREIADQHGMSHQLMMNILKALTQAGIVRSVRGARGGYALASASDSITLVDLIEAIEGEVKFVQCAADEGGEDGSSCDLLGTCPIRSPAQRIHHRLRAFLREITIAELADDESTPHWDESFVPLRIGVSGTVTR
jgi:Rrf2 family protein